MAAMVPVYNGSAARSHLKYTTRTPISSSGDPPPPPYQKTPNISPLPANPAGFSEVNPPSAAAAAAASQYQIPFSAHCRSHQIIGIYKVSHSDMTLALSATDANPISYISTHSYSRPHIELHATGSPKSPILSTAEFHHFSNSTTLIASSPTGPVTTQLDKDGLFSSARALYIVMPESGIRERFEWRKSSALDVQRLEGRGTGMCFVRVATGEVMAVYAGVSGWSTKKVGKFRWVGGRGGGTDVGDAGELLCVMSLLALLEKARRSSKRGSAGAIGGGAGGFSGGAGC